MRIMKLKLKLELEPELEPEPSWSRYQSWNQAKVTAPTHAYNDPAYSFKALLPGALSLQSPEA